MATESLHTLPAHLATPSKSTDMTKPWQSTERSGHDPNKVDRYNPVLDWHSFNQFQCVPTKHHPEFDW
jgi:hypothetical protein